MCGCREAILKLMDAIDSYVEAPPRALDKPFSMPVEDVFSIQGRGTVVTGRIEQGIVKVGDTIEIIGIQQPTTTTVTGSSPGFAGCSDNVFLDIPSDRTLQFVRDG